jgi:hypothetical protein
MNLKDELKYSVLALKDNPHDFENLAVEMFRYQAKHNLVYKTYLKHLKTNVKTVRRLQQIPCLPISFFKYHKVVTEPANPNFIFESSGTTGHETSKHFVSDIAFYEYNSMAIFQRQYGSLLDYHFFALLPNYLERSNSSLVYMMKSFIIKSYSTNSGFYLNDTKKLLHELKVALESDLQRKVILIGVTYALLDLAENPDDLEFLKKHKERIIIMETGGMKGRRREMLRDEVHFQLKQAFGVGNIHSEYGMTELLSQAYSSADGNFTCPPSMKVLLREVNDPFSYLPSFKVGKEEVSGRERGKTGGINVIDLANMDSCCFIETQDLGAFYEDYKYFRVLGRFDNSEVRGCNLMVNY